jgi:hypothetical protein
MQMELSICRNPPIVGIRHPPLIENSLNFSRLPMARPLHSLGCWATETSKMVLKIDRGSDAQQLVLRLSGRIQSEHVEQLNTEMKGSTQVVLDLKDVKLVDREVVCFLGSCEANGAELRHCSPYIREWILKEKASR